MGYYVADKTFDMGGGRSYRPGEHVPEADSHPNPRPWVERGFIKLMEGAPPKATAAGSEPTADAAPKRKTRQRRA